jgi:hypothetical protein
MFNFKINLENLNEILEQIYSSFILFDVTNNVLLSSFGFDYNLECLYVVIDDIGSKQTLIDYIRENYIHFIDGMQIDALKMSSNNEVITVRLFGLTIRLNEDDDTLMIMTPLKGIDLYKIGPLLLLSQNKAHTQSNHILLNGLEQKILLLLTLGYSYREISQLLHEENIIISENKVGQIVRNRIHKELLSSDRLDILTKSLDLGIITPRIE